MSSGWNCNARAFPNTNACDEFGRPGDLGRTGRHRPPIEVPLEPASAGNQVLVVADHVVPADLGDLGPCHRSAEGLRDQLAAEAHAQCRYARICRGPHHRHLRSDPTASEPVVVHRPARPKRDDDVVVGRIRERDVDVGGVEVLRRNHAERRYVKTAVSERITEHRLGSVVFVVQEQHGGSHGESLSQSGRGAALAATSNASPADSLLRSGRSVVRGEFRADLLEQCLGRVRIVAVGVERFRLERGGNGDGDLLRWADRRRRRRTRSATGSAPASCRW